MNQQPKPAPLKRQVTVLVENQASSEFYATALTTKKINTVNETFQSLTTTSRRDQTITSLDYIRKEKSQVLLLELIPDTKGIENYQSLVTEIKNSEDLKGTRIITVSTASKEQLEKTAGQKIENFIRTPIKPLDLINKVESEFTLYQKNIEGGPTNKEK